METIKEKTFWVVITASFSFSLLLFGTCINYYAKLDGEMEAYKGQMFEQLQDISISLAEVKTELIYTNKTLETFENYKCKND